MEYFKTFYVEMNDKKYYANVEYIDEYPEPFKGDVDEWRGLGNQKHDGFTIVTFHYIYQIRTTRKDGDFYSYLKGLHKQIRWNMEFNAQEKERKLKDKNDKSNKRLPKVSTV